MTTVYNVVTTAYNVVTTAHNMVTAVYNVVTTAYLNVFITAYNDVHQHKAVMADIEIKGTYDIVKSTSFLDLHLVIENEDRLKVRFRTT